ncbi:MAG: Gfo/Idh/MocA family oxidoreductase [Candidatus Bathyarchaeota archaeon]|nr:MAG: Gfo/Idh/MocA family oxidoreductase [Candidatus Bathyarchaeota archaeon]
MREVGVGVIGCGSIGLHHLKRLLELSSARVVAGCDVNPQALESFGVEAGLPKKSLHREYGRLLRQDDVEAVVVCLPNRLHSTVTVEAFEAGKHIYCEKPMAVNLSEATRMVEAAKRSGGKLLIGLQSRFRGDVQALKRHAADGELGEVYYAKCGWIRRSGVPGWGSWFTRKKDAGAGPIYDIGVHVLDLTLWLMSNFEPAAAYATSYAKFGPEKRGLSGWGKPEPEGYFDVEDLATALLKMGNGASVSFEVSWASHIKEPRRTVTLMGEKAGLDLESMTIYTTEEGGHVDKKIHFDEVDPYLVAMSHFVECILEDGEPLTRPEEMLGLQRALDMILKSSQEGGVVSSDEV